MLLSVFMLAKATAGEFKDLGVQISSSTVIGTTFGKDGNGRDAVYTVMRGHPAKLLSFDAESGSFIQSLPLEGATGAWNACTASDGSIYVGSDANAHLYRYIPGEKEVHDLGLVAPEQTFVWDVTPGKDGEVFLGTYPGGFVLRYHPKDGFTDIGRGAVAPGEQYVRSVSYDPDTGRVYAGVGSHAHLIEIDPKTSEKRDLLPPEYREQEFVYGVSVFDGRLFGLITRAEKSLVFSLKNDELIGILPRMNGQQVMIDGPGNLVYYTVDGSLISADYTDLKTPPRKLCECPNALGFTWIDDKLVAFTREGLVRYDPKTGKKSTTSVKLPAEPTDIQSIELGPDGRIWTGGYLSGGNGAYDPNTGETQACPGLSQAEDMTVVGDTIYFGLYPGAKIASYNTRMQWNPRANNPRRIADLGPENQSRPMAMLGVADLNQVFIGTIPEYGQLGGVLAVYDIGTGKIAVHHDVVPKQSICSLVYHKGLVIGGTTIFGGLGQKPEETEAKLFVWDPTGNSKTFETSVAGAKAITGLFVGPDGEIWGMAEGTLFIFNRSTLQVSFTKEILPIHYGGERHVWRDAFFVTHPNGLIYGTMGDKLFQLDPASKQVTILRDKGAGMLAMDRARRLYFRDGTHLWQYVP
jgi:streptogramin lyase